MQKFLRGLFDLALVALIVGGAYWVALHRNQLLDSYYLSNYMPPERVAALADQAALSDSARRLFYRARPIVEPDRSSLVVDCHISSNKTVELGCYLTNDRIYLLDINEPDLNSQMAVTAAHETLHAAYDRLSGGEKKRIDALLEQAVSGITSADLQDRLQLYQQTEPGQRDNELHSILGTEFGSLPPELEKYYGQYFTNRQAVVALSEHFSKTFDGLRTEIDQLDGQINSTKAEMKALLASGQVRRYNELVPIVNNEISNYNAKVERYNRYAGELLGEKPAASAQGQ